MTGFLLDENLPGRLVFTPSLPITHALDLGSSQADSQWWNHARAHRLAIMTKDADFSDRILVSGPPPVQFQPIRHGASSTARSA